MKKTGIIISSILIQIIISGKLSAEYSEKFLLLQGKTTDYIEQTKKITIQGKEYRKTKMYEEVKPEDIVYDIKAFVKEGASKKDISRVLKRHGLKNIHSVKETNIYYLLYEDEPIVEVKPSENSSRQEKVFGTYDELMKEKDVIEGLELNYMEYGKDVEYISGLVWIQFSGKLKEKEIERFLKDNKLQVIEKDEDSEYRVDIGTNTTVPATVSRLMFEKVVADIDPEYLAEIPEKEFLPNDNKYGDQWYLEQASDIDIDIEKAWRLMNREREVNIAVIDTGIDSRHEDLRGIANDNGDTEGHGTAIAGIIGAEVNNNIGISGICWNGEDMISEIRSIRIKHGRYAMVRDVIDSLEKAMEYDPQIINMSLTMIHKRKLEKAVKKALSKGIVMIASAGNDSSEVKNESAEETKRMIYPGAYEGVINVGSVGRTGLQSIFSNYGGLVDVYAPGEEIYTTALNNDYRYVSGTSMSAAIVTGIAALMKYENPQLTSTEIVTILKETSKNGMVNAYGALLKVKGMTENQTVLKQNPKPEVKRETAGITKPRDTHENTYSTKDLPKQANIESKIVIENKNLMKDGGKLKDVTENGNPSLKFIDKNGEVIKAIPLISEKRKSRVKYFREKPSSNEFIREFDSEIETYKKATISKSNNYAIVANNSFEKPSQTKEFLDYIKQFESSEGTVKYTSSISVYDDSGRIVFEKDFSSFLRERNAISDSGIVAVLVSYENRKEILYVYDKTGKEILIYPKEDKKVYPSEILKISSNGKYLAVSVRFPLPESYRTVFLNLQNGNSWKADKWYSVPEIDDEGKAKVSSGPGELLTIDFKKHLEK